MAITQVAISVGRDYPPRSLRKRVWKRIVWMLRYTKGGMDYAHVMALPKGRFAEIEESLNELIEEENEAAASRAGRAGSGGH